MSTSDLQVVNALLDHAAAAWAAGDDDRAEVWCQRAWAHAHGSVATSDEEANR